jgi:hypothetical protein
MKRRDFLTMLAVGATSGCLQLQEPSSTSTTDQSTAQSQPDSTSATPLPQTTGAATDVTATIREVQRLSLDMRLPVGISELTAHADTYAIALHEEIQLREFGTADPLVTLDIDTINPLIALTGSDCYTSTPMDSSSATNPTTPVRRYDPETGTQRAKTTIKGAIRMLSRVGPWLVCGSVNETDEFAQRYGNRITVLDAETLEQQWTTVFGNNSFPEAVCGIDGTLYVGFNNFLAAFDGADGTLRYRAPVTISYPRPYKGDLIADADGKLRRITPSIMEYDWSAGAGVAGRSVVHDTSVTVPTSDGVLSADVDSGAVNWSRTFESDSAFEPEQLRYHDGVLWYVDALGTLYLLDPQTGGTAASGSYDSGHMAATPKGVIVTDDDEVVELDRQTP